MNKTLLSETSYHILSLCVVISKKFPRLLAEREIIANAFNHSPNFSPNHVQSYKDKSKQQRKWRKKSIRQLLHHLDGGEYAVEGIFGIDKL